MLNYRFINLNLPCNKIGTANFQSILQYTCILSKFWILNAYSWYKNIHKRLLHIPPKLVVECLTLLLRIWGVSGTNLGPETGYPDGIHSWFSSVSRSECWGITHDRFLPSPIQFITYHSDIRRCIVLLTENTLLNKLQINKYIYYVSFTRIIAPISTWIHRRRCKNLSVSLNVRFTHYVLPTYLLNHKRNERNATHVRFQVLKEASMKLRFVFWDVLPCKIIVDRCFRGTCCLHHQGDYRPDGGGLSH
jgi:hypothetical protein